jgi:hypothetical protein
MIPLLLAAASSSAPLGDVALTGELVNASSTNPATATAEIRVDQDGNVYKVINLGGDTQLSSTDNWVRPTSGAPGAYQVRFTNVVGTTLDITSTTLADVWHPMKDGDFRIRHSRTSDGSDSSTFDIEIRVGTGSTVATDNYSLIATRNP